jgi:phenylalanyl-tRNA synthetase beta chain
MKISLNWLKDYVKVSSSLPKLIDKLNMIGLLVESWEEREDDIILDVETHANRPDTLGHLGVARELAAGFGLALKEKKWPMTEIEEKTSDIVDIQILDDDLCPRYCGIVIRDVQVGPSPEWLRKRIEAMGSKSINNVVDVSNYVLFSTAHPIHAFDLAKLAGGKVIIRKAKAGEALKSLEGEDIKLSPEMLVIADKEKPVALAGVIGGEESAVEETTRDVFIESAYFDPVSIRITGKKTAIQTDASYRFERGADISFPPHAAHMAASLLTQFGGKSTKGVIDVYPEPRKNKTVILRHNRISKLLGLNIDEDFTFQTLSNLGFQVENQQQGVWQVKVPFFRVDIEREADLIEEVARFYGYEKIPSDIPPLEEIETVKDPRKTRISKLRNLLFHYGFDEFINFSFFDPEKETIFRTDRKPVEIRNPFSQKASLLRTTLLGGLLENVSWNKNRGAEGVHGFETGNIYFWEDDKTHEQLTLALVTTGRIGSEQWIKEGEMTDFFHLKGTCEALMIQLRYESFSFQEEDHPFFEKEYSVVLTFKGETIGYLGLVKKEILRAYSLKEPAWAAELNLDELFEKQPYSFQYKPVVKFPSVSRDVSFIIDENVSYREIKDVLEKLSVPYLEKFDIYDRFSGASVPKGKNSLSLRFIYHHPQRTLRAEEVDDLQKKIIKSLSANFNFQLRKGGKIDK